MIDFNEDIKQVQVDSLSLIYKINSVLGINMKSMSGTGRLTYYRDQHTTTRIEFLNTGKYKSIRIKVHDEKNNNYVKPVNMDFNCFNPSIVHGEFFTEEEYFQLYLMHDLRYTYEQYQELVDVIKNYHRSLTVELILWAK